MVPSFSLCLPLSCLPQVAAKAYDFFNREELKYGLDIRVPGAVPARPPARLPARSPHALCPRVLARLPALCLCVPACVRMFVH